MALHYISATATFAAHALVKHRAAFAAVIAELPSAVEAMRRSRAARPPTPRSVFILDWDDTCCATSFLERSGFMADLDSRIDEFAPEEARLLRVLESRVLSLLKTAVSLGTVLIVTNAGDGWVELSSSRFLPAVRAFLEANYKSVKVISARARYVDVYREHPLQWKALTFADELKALYDHPSYPPHPMHVLVLGDSVGDQYAAHVAASALTNAGKPIVLKVVKFLERPSIDQLCKELEVLLDHIVAMTTHSGAFDVSMYREAPPAAQQSQQQAQHHNALQSHYHTQTAATPPKTAAEPLTPSSIQQPPSDSLSNSSLDAAMTQVSPMATCSAAV